MSQIFCVNRETTLGLAVVCMADEKITLLDIYPGAANNLDKDRKSVV